MLVTVHTLRRVAIGSASVYGGQDDESYGVCHRMGIGDDEGGWGGATNVENPIMDRRRLPSRVLPIACEERPDSGTISIRFPAGFT